MASTGIVQELARAGVDAQLGVRYGLGLGVIEVDLSDSSFFNRFHFRVGEAIGGSLQAVMILESGVIDLARATALGVKDLSQGLLSRYGVWGKGVSEGSKKLINSRVQHFKRIADEYLGKNYTMKLNKSGDPIFIDAKNMKWIRFDVRNSHGDEFHGHVEIKVGNRWRDYTEQHRVYIRNNLEVNYHVKNKPEF